VHSVGSYFTNRTVVIFQLMFSVVVRCIERVTVQNVN